MFRLFLVAVIFSTTSVVCAESSCVLPPYPENGRYMVLDNPSAKPGQTVNSYALQVDCDVGYKLVGNPTPVCRGLDVTPLPESYCFEKTKNVFTCGSDQRCYQKTTLFQTAEDGPSASPRHLNDEYCGIIGSIVEKTLSGGVDAEKYELPWHTGIFSKSYKPYMQICGGSLISPTVVITAAHCFWDDVRKLLPAEDYAVAVGKIYRPWNDHNDDAAQKPDVREIKIPPRFLGSAANFQEDLALVIVRNAFFFSDAVNPVCLDFHYSFDSKQLTNGALGKVAGWSLVSQDGRPSPTLQVAQVPHIAIEECIADSEPSFRSFLTSDKICAGYTNGPAVCKGDSGGGLSFPELGPDGHPRYYLRGVVSSAPRSDHLCSVYNWATFTHLLRHQHFILNLLQEIKKDIHEPTASDGLPLIHHARQIELYRTPIKDTNNKTFEPTTSSELPPTEQTEQQTSPNLTETSTSKLTEVNFVYHIIQNFFK